MNEHKTETDRFLRGDLHRRSLSGDLSSIFDSKPNLRGRTKRKSFLGRPENGGEL